MNTVQSGPQQAPHRNHRSLCRVWFWIC